MHINVKGAKGSTLLCPSCKHAQIMRGAAMKQEVVWCSKIYKSLRFPVVECSAYVHLGTPSLYDMQEVAWVLETSKTRDKVGFVPAKRWRERHKGEDILPDQDI